MDKWFIIKYLPQGHRSRAMFMYIDMLMYIDIIFKHEPPWKGGTTVYKIGLGYDYQMANMPIYGKKTL